MPIVFNGIRFDEGFRAAIIVASKVLLELKTVERVVPFHKKQVQTYLRLTGLMMGYLLNFGDAVLKSRISRCVNGLEERFSAAQRLSGRNESSVFSRAKNPHSEIRNLRSR